MKGSRIVVIKQEVHRKSIHGPKIGSTGTIVSSSDTGERVAVEYDKPFPGGHTLGGYCKDGYGWYTKRTHITPPYIDERL